MFAMLIEVVAASLTFLTIFLSGILYMLSPFIEKAAGSSDYTGFGRPNKSLPAFSICCPCFAFVGIIISFSGIFPTRIGIAIGIPLIVLALLVIANVTALSFLCMGRWKQVSVVEKKGIKLPELNLGKTYFTNKGLMYARKYQGMFSGSEW